MIANFKSGFVSIVGKPNVGKSTLMNRLIGDKLSIVTPKPQTTRQNIKGFCNLEQGQIIFLDTPGFLEPRYELQTKMMSFVFDSLKNSDIILFIADISDFPTDYDWKVLRLLDNVKKPKILVYNKNDKATAEHKSDTNHESGFDKVFYLSALYDKDFSELLDCLLSFLPYSPPLYDTDELSDMPLRFFAGEIIREKIFLFYDAEIPYSSTVVVEKWTEEPDRDVIQANIWVERDSQKPIILGKNGKQIGKVRASAEKDIMQLTGRNAVLNLWVKIKKDWRKKKGAINEFGYK